MADFTVFLLGFLVCSHDDFMVIVELGVGSYEYKYFVDGAWTYNPLEVKYIFRITF